MPLDFSKPVGQGQIGLTDYKGLTVRYMFMGNPYGITATDFATARSQMMTLAERLNDLSALSINKISFEIELQDADPKPFDPTHAVIKWFQLLAVETTNGFNSILEIPSPLPNLYPAASPNRLDLNHPKVKAFINAFTQSGLPNDEAAMLNGQFITHDASGGMVLGQSKTPMAQPPKK